MTPFEIILSILFFGILVALIIVIYNQHKSKGGADKEVIRSAVNESLGQMTSLISDNITKSNQAYNMVIDSKIAEIKSELKLLNEASNKSFIDLTEQLNRYIEAMAKAVRDENDKGIQNLNLKFDDFSKSMKEKYELLEGVIAKALENLSKQNDERLASIQKTVDEKLQKTLDERLKSSFDNVVAQIGDVNKAIGEIKNLAGGVESLKTTLTNVKAKGIVGEVILGNIISEVLVSSQYETNFATKRGSSERVEFAIKMPGGEGDEYVYLPLDSKFPLESYNKLRDAQENGDKEGVELARRELRQKLRSFAKDISTKYIDVPNTTDFAIMFLPIEGLYIETIESGLFEEIQREYKINIVGPSTLYAFLNSLRSGFNSVAIQKHSNEVFMLLKAIKAEFEKFADSLQSAYKKINAAGDEINTLITTRSNKMNSKLKGITSSISLSTANEILGIVDEENDE